MAELLRGLLQGLRSLRGNPSFTLAVVASLTLGIGANSAVFSVVDALLLRPLPYGDPDRLILIEGSIPARGWDGLMKAKTVHPLRSRPMPELSAGIASRLWGYRFCRVATSPKKTCSPPPIPYSSTRRWPAV